MGFRSGAYAKCWEIDPKKPTWTKVRLSISKKNKETGVYDQDFSGFVDFIGTACASKAAQMENGARIKLGDVDVTNYYDKEKKVEYTNFKVFSFDIEDDSSRGGVRDVDPHSFIDVEGDSDNMPW